MNAPFTPDPADFTMGGAYYPTGHVFAMFADAPAAQRGADAITAIAGIGAAQRVPAAAIEQAFAQRAADVGGIPSVEREDQFMLRFVELARGGKPGLLIDAGTADTRALGDALRSAGAVLAYHYRTLVIEELVDPTPRAEAAAAGRL